MYAVNRFSLSSLRSLDRLASRLVVLDLHRAVIPAARQSRDWILRVTKTTGTLYFEVGNEARHLRVLHVHVVLNQ